ncbi:MAG: pentapeptide repeat-containing protein [Bacteroidales bacterium]|nr:pentapeptide repeat-containing protein [Bacteroidales bacterium]
MSTKEDKTYQDIDFRVVELEEEYYRCTFQHCDFSELQMGKTNFEECRFVGCNFSLSKMSGTSWNRVVFERCKMTGTNFSAANKFTFNASFKECVMQYASFQGLNLEGTPFEKCHIIETDFSQCKLKKARFVSCDLTRTVFLRSDLEGADFTMAYNFVIHPNDNKMKGARFALQGLPGLLAHYGIVVE